MASLYDSVNYCNAGDEATTGYYAVPKWAANTAYTAGQIVRPKTAPAVGNERLYVCIVAGTSANPTEPTWAFTRGVKVTDGANIIWQECTGIAALNGDLTNTYNWTQAKALSTPTLGAVIQRNSGASLQICTTAGTMAVAEPSFSNTAGTTTADGTSVWTSLGAPGNFAAWANPHARLANACAISWLGSTAVVPNGPTVYVADNHAESQATAITIAPAGTTPAVVKVLCVNHSGSMPPVAADLTTGATISTTAASVNITYNSGNHYTYGLTFKAGNGAASGVNSILITGSAIRGVFDNCAFWLMNTTTSNTSQISLPNTAADLVWNNCTVKFAVVTNFIGAGLGQFHWQNTGSILVSGSSVPTRLFLFGSVAVSTPCDIMLEALDLNQLTGALQVYNTTNSPGNMVIKDCKLNASMTVTVPVVPGQTVQFFTSDTGATAYKSSKYKIEGTETTETTITRVGGAVDLTGQAQARKIVTTANCQFAAPFECEPLAIWNPTTGANVTLTICGTINSASLPNNDELWADIEYLGTASFPQGVFNLASKKATILTAGAAFVSADASSWNGGGSGAGWSPFKLVVTLSSPQPQLAGLIWVRFRAGKASTTYYIDPKVVLS